MILKSKFELIRKRESIQRQFLQNSSATSKHICAKFQAFKTLDDYKEQIVHLVSTQLGIQPLIILGLKILKI